MAGRGRFITLEGGEGVGKSTLAAALKFRLGERGIDLLLTREPGGTPWADKLRQAVLTIMGPPGVRPDPLAEALAFYAARSDHLTKRIRPYLQSGGWVVCDRFSDSTRAYQTVAGGALNDAIEEIERIVVGPTQPDLTLILDLPLSTARLRMAQRGEPKDAIESRETEYHEAVRRAFLDIARANPQRCVVLDASKPPAEVADDAIAAINARLGDG